MLVLFYDFFILITKFRLKTLYLAELEQAAANEIKKSNFPLRIILSFVQIIIILYYKWINSFNLPFNHSSSYHVPVI